VTNTTHLDSRESGGLRRPQQQRQQQRQQPLRLLQ